MYLLGYDIGSSSVKASLVDAQTGKCLSSAFYPKSEAAIMAIKPGWAEQDPSAWWETAPSRSRSFFMCVLPFQNLIRATKMRPRTSAAPS